MAETTLQIDDLIALFQGRVLYRDESGLPANPPSGDTNTRRHAIELAINPTDLETLQHLIQPKFWETPGFKKQADE